MLKQICPLAPIVLLLACLCIGCGTPDTPEAQIRQALSRMEAAVEARDLGDFRNGLSAQYRDEDGRDANEMANVVRGYFVLNQSIHLLTRINQIGFPATDEARVSITVGMAGKEAASGDAWSLAAEVHDFDVTLMNKDGDWRITFARWLRPG